MKGRLIAALLFLATCSHPGSSMQPADVTTRKNEINDYWMQIREWRVASGMPADPEVPFALDRMMSVDKLRECKGDPKPKEPVCADTCSLKEAICENALRICEIADELGGDAWASGKCRSAKASCKEATQRCCECSSA